MRACMVLRMEKERGGVENEREDKKKRKEED
jgi:hypothetical protein